MVNVKSMKVFTGIIKYLRRGIVSLLIVAVLAILVTSFSLCYDFAPAEPFVGDDIYNPYTDFEPNMEWQRASLHTHTKVEGPLNECDFTAEQVWAKYQDFGYDVVGISNHNEITQHPASEQDIRIYEHGYNLRNFHKLVVGTERVNRFDALYPLFPSQAQWQLDMLGGESELLQLNHPSRSSLLDSAMLCRIAGYDIMELSGYYEFLENKHWDWALSAGRYSFATLNDDLHYPDRSSRFAIRTTYLGAKSATTEDIIASLRSGCFYSVRVPDYGAGDWSVKREANMTLPEVVNIGACGDTLFMRLSSPAEQIRVIGQNHSLLSRTMHSDSIAYVMRGGDAYARFVASYPDSLIIMSNPFARYDSSRASSPADRSYYVPNIPATVGYNLVVVLLIGGLIFCYVNIVKRWRR